MDPLINVNPLLLMVLLFAGVGAINLIVWAGVVSDRLRKPESRKFWWS